MKRRTFLAGAATAATVLGGTAGARLTNRRWYDPDPTTDPSLPSGQRVFEADRSLSVLDHRAVTTATVLEDGTDRTPFRRSRYRYEHERSRHRYRYVSSTFAVPEGAPPPVFGHLHARRHAREARNADEADDLPVTTVTFHSPGVAVHAPRAETPADADERPRVDDSEKPVSRARGFGRQPDDRPEPRPTFVLSPDAKWERVEAGEGRERFEIRNRDAYAAVVPVATTADAVEDGSRIRATLEADTGRLRELEDRRVVEQLVGDREDQNWRTFTYRIRTRFDRYGDVRASMPGGPVPEPSAKRRAGELWTELRTY